MSNCVKTMVNEAGVRAVVSNCDYISEVTKTATPSEDSCTTGEVNVSLSLTFSKEVSNVKIVDNIANNFIDSVKAGTIVASKGTATEASGLKIEWNIPTVTVDETVTLTYTVIVKDSAKGKQAYVNNNVTVNSENQPTCSFNHTDGIFNDDFIINCGCDTITDIKKEIENNVIGCTDNVDVTLTMSIDEALASLVITDTLASQYVSNVTNIVKTPDVGNVTIQGNQIIWTISPSEATTYKLQYSVSPNLDELTGYVNESINVNGVGAEGNTLSCIYTRTSNPDVFEDNYTIECNVNNVQCCCASCETFTSTTCESSNNQTLQVDNIECNGRMVNVSVYFPKVCPGKKLVVGVSLIEKTLAGDVPRGFKVKELITPTNEQGTCEELMLTNFCFIMADSEPCVARTFVAKAMAQYVDINSLDCDCE